MEHKIDPFSGPRGNEIRSWVEGQQWGNSWGTNNPFQNAVYSVATGYAYGEFGGYFLGLAWKGIQGLGIFSRAASTVVTEAGSTTGLQISEGIYEFTATSGKTYVGQSGNIAERLAQHAAIGKVAPETTVKVTEVLGGKLEREIAEQVRINSLGGIYQNQIHVLENIRNPLEKAREYLLP